MGNGSEALLLTVSTAQLSLVTGRPKSTPLAVHSSASAATLTITGQVISGSSLSITVTSKLSVVMLPAASLTSKTLVVVPTGNNDPLGKPAICCTWPDVAK